jgi:hypothetical protein
MFFDRQNYENLLNIVGLAEKNICDGQKGALFSCNFFTGEYLLRIYIVNMRQKLLPQDILFFLKEQ